MRRPWGFVLIVVGALGVALASSLLTLRLGADREQPAPAGASAPPITAEVRQVTVRRTVPVRVQIISDTVEIVHVPSQIDGKSVVTSVHVAVGEAVSDGTVLLTIAARPVIALYGEIPAFRTMGRGDSGEDIRQLQQALIRLGHLDGDADGVYGSATARAVARLYDELSFPFLAEAGEIAGSEESLVPSPDRPTRSQAAVPFGEVFFVPWRRALVDQVPATVGNMASVPLVRLRTSVVRARLELSPEMDVPPESYVLLADGTRGDNPTMVTHTEDDGSTRRRAEFSFQASTTGLQVGQVAPATLVLAETDRPVLAVPAAAIRRDAGGLYIVRRRGDTAEEITIEVGVAGDDAIEIVPSREGAVRPGDQIVLFGS